MDAEFWHQRWQLGQIGFHLEEVNPLLPRFISQVLPGSGPDGNHEILGKKVFVPLCGKSRDIAWLLKQGLQVVACELSEQALDQLAYDLEGEFGLAIDKQAMITADGQPARFVYRAAGITLFSGDIFTLAEDLALQPQAAISDALKHIDWIYDRAALIALPQAMRSDYSACIAQLAGTPKQLLITLEYDQSRMDGPPFNVDDAEVQSLYDSDYQLQLLAREEQIELEPRFKAKGLDSFIQCVYLLTPRN